MSSPLDAEGKKNLNVQFFVFCVCFVRLYEKVEKNKVCQEIPFLSFFLLRPRFLFPWSEDILDKCKNGTRSLKYVG